MRIGRVASGKRSWRNRWFDRSDYIETLDLRSELTMSGLSWVGYGQKVKQLELLDSGLRQNDDGVAKTLRNRSS